MPKKFKKFNKSDNFSKSNNFGKLDKQDKIAMIKNLVNVPKQMEEIITLYHSKKAEINSREFKLNDVTFTLVDIKLPRFKEDLLYKNDKIHYLVSRGLCFVFANNKYVHTLCGHPKFGENGDYIHDVDPINIHQKIFRSKENGECGHWSAFTYNGQNYTLFGSKNVHGIFRSNNIEEDIKLYTESRYMYTIKNASYIAKYYKAQNEAIIQFLSETGYTFCFESCFIDSQHLVKYDADTLYFFGITGMMFRERKSLCMNPLDSDKIFNKFYLKTPMNTLVTGIGELDLHEKKFAEIIENAENSEGAVVNCIDDKGNVIYVYKHKNYSYIFRRAVREKMRKKVSMRTIVRRLRNLHIVHPREKEMTQQMLQFNAYFHSLSPIDKKNFFSQWITWEETFNKLSESIRQEIFDKYVESIKMRGTLMVIMFVGMPGSGKSFLARALKYIFAKLYPKNAIVHLEQDMFAHLGRNASKSYDKAIKKAIFDSNTQLLILSKSNHNKNVRNKTYDILDECKKEVERIYVTIGIPDENPDEIIDENSGENSLIRVRDICVERIMQRGNAHKSLFGKPKSEIEKILTDVFVQQWENLTEFEETYPVVNINILADRKTNIMSCIAQMQEHNMIENIDINETDIIEAFEHNKNEDEKIIKENSEHQEKKSKEHTRKIMYDALIISNSDDVLLNIPSVLTELEKYPTLVTKNNFHITLEYFGGVSIDLVPEFKDDVELQVTIVGYAINEKACALLVEIPEIYNRENGNKYNHITFALDSNILAKYSSELIEESIKNDTFVELDTLITINAKTKRIFCNP